MFLEIEESKSIIGSQNFRIFIFLDQLLILSIRDRTKIEILILSVFFQVCTCTQVSKKYFHFHLSIEEKNPKQYFQVLFFIKYWTVSYLRIVSTTSMSGSEYYGNLRSRLLKQQLSVYLTEDWSTVEYRFQLFDISTLRWRLSHLPHAVNVSLVLTAVVIKVTDLKSITWADILQNRQFSRYDWYYTWLPILLHCFSISMATW